MSRKRKQPAPEPSESAPIMVVQPEADPRTLGHQEPASQGPGAGAGLPESGTSPVVEGPPKRGRGAPTLYSPALCEELLDYFEVEPYRMSIRTITRKDGSTVEEEVKIPNELPTLAGFAVKVGVHRDTLHEWGRVHPEFSDAIKKAKDNQERILVSNGLENLYAQPFAIFTAKNLTGWRDKLAVESSGPDGGPIKSEVTVTMTPVEAYLTLKNGGQA